MTGHRAVVVSVGGGEPALVLDRREPGLEKVGAEGEHEPGAREVMCRKAVDPEDLAVGFAHRLVIERLVADDFAAQCRGPRGQQVGEGPTPSA